MAKKKLKECYSCKQSVHEIITMKVSKVSLDLETSMVMIFFPLCISCSQNQMNYFARQLAEKKGELSRE